MRLRTIAWGRGLQFFFAVIVLKTVLGLHAMLCGAFASWTTCCLPDKNLDTNR